MAIPPIISNNPLFKLFRTEQQTVDNGKETSKAASFAPAIQQDVVEISRAALQRLDGIRPLASDDEARETADDTRTILEESEYTLGDNSIQA